MDGFEVRPLTPSYNGHFCQAPFKAPDLFLVNCKKFFDYAHTHYTGDHMPAQAEKIDVVSFSFTFSKIVRLFV
jgi:hypothetical protein